jgi:NADH-quinone oxidoreductase subunit I
MRATAPAGNARYEGVVAWSGERGYGVRSPELGQSEQADDPATVEEAHEAEETVDHDEAGH